MPFLRMLSLVAILAAVGCQPVPIGPADQDQGFVEPEPGDDD